MKFGFLKVLQEVASTANPGESSAAENTPASGSWLSSLSPLIMIAIFGVVFYLFILRPEKKRKKEAQDLRESMRVGDTVITIGGITGEIESIRKETITIFTGNNSIDIQKWAVRSVEPNDEAVDEEDDIDETEEEAK